MLRLKMMLGYLLVSGALLLLRKQSLADTTTNLPDGFNLYKDFLRSKVDEPMELSLEHGDPIMYVYKKPTILLVSPLPDGETEVTKRGANRFKNFMLSPQREAELAESMNEKGNDDHIFHFPRVAIKRSIGTSSIAV